MQQRVAARFLLTQAEREQFQRDIRALGFRSVQHWGEVQAAKVRKQAQAGATPAQPKADTGGQDGIH